VADCGPYARQAADLFVTHAAAVRHLLARYDVLTAGVDPHRAVLTHGEPHPGNTMRTADGWRLVDWDTTLIAQPERDLWMLGPDAQKAYGEAAGVAPRPEMLRMYRTRWDLSDLAVEADRFRHPHTGTADDAESWTILQRVVSGISLDASLR
jgi:spectinomycin phosphotransferase/16S rRNA (guanine(1405)-N(7))-methyltransferase